MFPSNSRLTNFKNLGRISCCININMTNAIRMTQDWDILALFFNHSHQFIRPSRNHEVDVMFQLQQVTHILPGIDLIIQYQECYVVWISRIEKKTQSDSISKITKKRILKHKKSSKPNKRSMTASCIQCLSLSRESSLLSFRSV